MKLKIAIAQINPTVGDLKGNAEKIIAAYEKGAREGADLVICPEAVLTGYPLEDLILRESFLDATYERAMDLEEHIRALNMGAALIYGTPTPAPNGGAFNSAFLIEPQGNTQKVNKIELPNYGVFDEKRHFISGENTLPLLWRGIKLGLMICEDCWFPKVTQQLTENGADLLIAINGSPFEIGKRDRRRQVVVDRVMESVLPFVYVNMVGGQDELVFDGASFLYDMTSYQAAPAFVEGVFCYDIEFERQGERTAVIDMTVYPVDDQPEEGIQAIYEALVLGTRDYMRKQGFKSVLLGYSGGVDSGLVAAIAADAVGAQNVHLVRLPSKYSSDGSLNDAEEGADRLGALLTTIPIEGIVDSLRNAYTMATRHYAHSMQARALQGTADENIQARARGNILMAISNQEGHLLLTTGNKSEVSVGYSTLYGDMSGGFNPVKDCYKTTVWELCRWRNGLYRGEIADLGFLGPEAEVVPEAIIVKPPSAELRPDQKDEDSLPPYHVLDGILRGMIEEEKSIVELIGEDFSEDDVRRVRNLVDGAEYKRRQAAPGIKITSKIHGLDRRYPIVNKWRA